jgi:hypothetical protein
VIAIEQLAALARIGALFRDDGIDFWLFGGWAVDFHAGSVTRAHHDVDLAVWQTDHPRIATLLEADGWAHAPEAGEDGYTAYERGGRRPARLWGSVLPEVGCRRRTGLAGMVRLNARLSHHQAPGGRHPQLVHGVSGRAVYSTLRGRYCSASARWALPMFSAPARSATVRASLSTRW